MSLSSCSLSIKKNRGADGHSGTRRRMKGYFLQDYGHQCPCDRCGSTGGWKYTPAQIEQEARGIMEHLSSVVADTHTACVMVRAFADDLRGMRDLCTCQTICDQCFVTYYEKSPHKCNGRWVYPPCACTGQDADIYRLVHSNEIQR